MQPGLRGGESALHLVAGKIVALKERSAKCGLLFPAFATDLIAAQSFDDS
jgi:hypothetical protein